MKQRQSSPLDWMAYCGCRAGMMAFGIWRGEMSVVFAKAVKNLSGVYWNWLKSEKNSGRVMLCKAAWALLTNGSGRIFTWENIPGAVEEALCPRVKLLLLPRRPGVLSHRRSAGRAEQPEFSIAYYGGFSPVDRRPPRAVCVRLPLPIRMDSRPAS